jgi:hypothetical protein
MARWEKFRSCPGCGYDFATAEGEKSCNYYDCPYLPAELNVFCDACRFDFFTMEGNPSCEDPMICEHGQEARSHVKNVRKWRELLRQA